MSTPALAITRQLTLQCILMALAASLLLGNKLLGIESSLLDSISCALLLLGVGLSGFSLYKLRANKSPLADDDSGEIAEITDFKALVESPENIDISGLNSTFAKNTQRLIAALQQRTLSVSLDAAHLRKFTQDAQTNSTQQEELGEMIAQASEETNQALENISTRTQAITENNSENLKLTQNSSIKMQEMAVSMDETVAKVDSFAHLIQDLMNSSEHIETILKAVQSFSGQTSMLALNASIEAARAGDAGRGFAVVADEVRDLATKVKEATDNIDEVLQNIKGSVNETASETQQITQKITSASTSINQFSQEYQTILAGSEASQTELVGISASVKEMLQTNQQNCEKSAEIKSLSQTIASDMSRANEHSQDLRSVTEFTLELLSKFITGTSKFETILAKLQSHREDFITTVLDQMNQEGLDIFDQQYQSVPNTRPEKFSTNYSARIKELGQQKVDDWKNSIEGSIYCLAVCKDGFLHMHHSQFSQEMTGDYETDLVSSRHCRFYTGNETEIRRSSSEAPLLLQTYLRDTGEVLFDLSIPVYYQGKHWGAIINGLPLSALMD